MLARSSRASSTGLTPGRGTRQENRTRRGGPSYPAGAPKKTCQGQDRLKDMVANTDSSSSLDYTIHNRNRFCGRRSLATRIDIDGRLAYRYLKLGCNAWGCPVCGPKKARRLQKAIAASADEHRLTKLLTLTLDPKSIPPDADMVKYIR